jgi:hypothetical protein
MVIVSQFRQFRRKRTPPHPTVIIEGLEEEGVAQRKHVDLQTCSNLVEVAKTWVSVDTSQTYL